MLIFLQGCQKDTLIDKDEQKDAQREVITANYTFDDACVEPWNDPFCPSLTLPDFAYAYELVTTGGGGEPTRVLDVQFSDAATYRVLPFITSDSTRALLVDNAEEFIVLTGGGGTLFPDDSLELASGEHADLLGLLSLDLFGDGDTSPDLVLAESFAQDDSGVFQLNADELIGPGTGVYGLAKLCAFERQSSVGLFLRRFFRDGVDIPDLRSIVIEAYENCPASYGGDRYCPDQCVEPTCVVDYIDALPAVRVSEYTKGLVKARFLQQTTGLTDSETNWLALPSNSDLLSRVYSYEINPMQIGECAAERCGIVGGVHEIIRQARAGETLTPTQEEELIKFFMVMSCEDIALFDCLRTGQQDPDGEIANFLEQVKAAVANDPLALVGGCDDLSPYEDDWFQLATFDALGVATVADRLEDLGEDYWIQTLENATSGLWWNQSPAVNMDFFGVTITQFPLKPNSAERFTPNEFFEFIRLNWATSTFYGEDGDCSAIGEGNYFDYNSQVDADIWLSSSPVSSVFTIRLLDDGSVITSAHEPFSSFTFSTLNVPGWTIGGSNDGRHPVSGNRQFGLRQNPDGSYTFYTTGVDRVTAWYHALAEGLALQGGTDFWVCFQDLMRAYVEDNGGSVSASSDCIVVNPKWNQLRDLLRQGCTAVIDELPEFPCETVDACP